MPIIVLIVNWKLYWQKFSRCWPVPGAKACDELLESYCLHVKTLKVQLVITWCHRHQNLSSKKSNQQMWENATAIEKESCNVEEFVGFCRIRASSCSSMFPQDFSRTVMILNANRQALCPGSWPSPCKPCTASPQGSAYATINDLHLVCVQCIQWTSDLCNFLGLGVLAQRKEQ